MFCADGSSKLRWVTVPSKSIMSSPDVAWSSTPPKPEILKVCDKELLQCACTFLKVPFTKKQNCDELAQKVIANWNGALPTHGPSPKGKVLKSEMVQQLAAKGITTTMSASGNVIKISEKMTVVQLQQQLDKAQELEESEVDSSESESEDAAVEAEEDAEEEVQDDCDEVIYLAHL